MSAATRKNFPFQLRRDKPVILSVTGSPGEVAQCFASISQVQSLIRRMDPGIVLMIEINLSCPNILDKPPPAYDAGSLAECLTALARKRGTGPGLVVAGIKTPPYTYQDQYNNLLSALEISTKLPGGCPISFITATNTLGSCLAIGPNKTPALGSASGEGIGGMAGSALRPLALGNVAMIRKMLDAHEALKRIAVIGVGGVSDKAGYERMRSVGAVAVGVGTAFGREGIAVFENIGRSDG